MDDRRDAATCSTGIVTDAGAFPLVLDGVTQSS
jgi:hypothetical protein